MIIFIFIAISEKIDGLDGMFDAHTDGNRFLLESNTFCMHHLKRITGGMSQGDIDT